MKADHRVPNLVDKYVNCRGAFLWKVWNTPAEYLLDLPRRAALWGGTLTCHKWHCCPHNPCACLRLFRNLIKSTLGKAHGAPPGNHPRAGRPAAKDNLIVLLSVLPPVVEFAAGGSPFRERIPASFASGRRLNQSGQSETEVTSGNGAAVDRGVAIVKVPDLPCDGGWSNVGQHKQRRRAIGGGNA